MTCEVCGRYPHDRRCPNCETQDIGECSNCGLEIMIFDEYYIDDNGEKFCCPGCALSFHGIKSAVKYEDEYE